MTDNNVVSIFWDKNTDTNNWTQVSSTREEVLNIVDETLEWEDVELTIDGSFTIDNIIGALVSNKFHNTESYIKEGLISNKNHDYTESIIILYEIYPCIN